MALTVPTDVCCSNRHRHRQHPRTHPPSQVDPPPLRRLLTLRSNYSPLQRLPSQALWRRKVQEFVQVREARRALTAARPFIPLTPMGILPLLKAFLFDPFDPEWSCDTKRKIGTPVYAHSPAPAPVCTLSQAPPVAHVDTQALSLRSLRPRCLW